MNWFYLPINPDPWAVGPLGVGKKNGKFFPYVGRNQQLDAYKQAVREELESQEVEKLPEGKYELEFYFWRRLDGSARNIKNIADATNLQKATEDALQGVLISNDRDVVRVTSTIVEQSSETKPAILIRAEMWGELDSTEIPDEMWLKIDQAETVPLFDNSWIGPNM